MVRIASICLLCFLSFQPPAHAADSADSATVVALGSRDTHRVQIDAFYSEVYIYVGGSFPVGTDFEEMQFLFDQGNASGYITPIFFEQTSPGIYTVRGIGKGFQVEQNAAPQIIPFTILLGRKTPQNANSTFGFVNAIVNGNGLPVLTSAGVVDYISPANGNHGVGGAGTTNDWGATEAGTTSIGLGTTFGAAGTDYPFTLPYRTYSAFVLGTLPQ